MRKFLILINILLIFTFVLPGNSTNFLTNNIDNLVMIEDEKIAINITLDTTEASAKIEHFTNYQIAYAVTEYVVIESGERISRLVSISVSDNKFTVPKGTLAIKVHQIKTLKNGVYYTYSTTGKNVVGNFQDVIRKNIAEIKTTAVNEVRTNVTNTSKSTHKYIEFYFDFKDDHDIVHSVDVDYQARTVGIFGIKGKWENHSEVKIKASQNWIMKPLIPGLPNVEVKALETNTKSDFKGTHVLRVAPTASNYPSKIPGVFLSGGWQVQNFAIIRIEYEINGEFIISDVINDPVTPEQEKLNWLFDFIDKMKEYFEQFKNFFSGNSSTILKVIAIIGGLIIYAIFSPFLKLLYKALKTVFNLIVKALASIFGVFF